MLRPLACLSLLGLAFALAKCSTSEAERPVVRSVRQATNGAPTAEANSYGVGVCLGGSRGACNEVCSGTLIAPNLVLTARHCVDNDSGSEIASCGVGKFTGRHWQANQINITTNSRTTQATLGWHGVSEVRTPTTSTDFCESDIALLVLADQVAGADAKPADVLAFGPLTDHTRYTTDISLIGYGYTSANAPTSVGERRILRDVPIDCIVGDPTYSDDPFCTAGGRITRSDGGAYDLLDDKASFLAAYGGCGGDSGSGAYDEGEFRAGHPLVVGVLSRGGPDSSVCTLTTFTRTDYWKDFLVQGATDAAKLGGFPVPAWTTGPTPTAAEAAAADAGLLKGAKGEACERPADCASSACVAVGDKAPVCVDRCGAGRTCEQGTVCSTLEGSDVCLPTVPGAGAASGCSIGRALPSTRAALVLPWLAVIVLRRRRR
jgi:hypothetical protein